MTDTQWTSLTAMLSVGVATLFNFAVQAYREERAKRWDVEQQARQRQWDMEDRDRRAKDVAEAAKKHAEEVAAALAEKVELTAQIHDMRAGQIAAGQHEIAVKQEQLLKAVAENTEVSVTAFRESNNYNNKLAALGLAIKDGKVLKTDLPVEPDAQPKQ